LKSSELLSIAKTDLRRLLSERPELALNLLANLSQLLRRFADLVEELTLRGVLPRVAGFLLTEARRRGHPRVGGLEFELATSKTELARRLGTVSETLSRSFHKLRVLGAVEVRGRRVRIMSPELLEEIASGSNV
jgi:CRP-like cAMP-binding protein